MPTGHTPKRSGVVRLFAMAVLYAFLCIPYGHASSFGTEAFASLYPLLAQLSDQNSTDNEALQAEIDKTSNAFDAIVKEFNGRETPLPAAFNASIEAYREQLSLALGAHAPKDALDVMSAVRQDAELKRQFLFSTSGFSPFDRPMLVTVSVVTFRGDKDEPGYRVTCNPFRDATQKSHARFPFASDTNKASLPMPPGRYRLQLYKGQTLLLSRDILIGLSSKPIEEVRIDVSNF